MSSGDMRKLMMLVEGTIHGHADAVNLVRDGWYYHEKSGRWMKEGVPFQIGADHLEVVFVYDANDPVEAIADFETARQAIIWVAREMDNNPQYSGVAEEIITEGSDLYCQNCGDNLGKDTENSKRAYCGQCGEYTRNPRGSDD